MSDKLLLRTIICQPNEWSKRNGHISANISPTNTEPRRNRKPEQINNQYRDWIVKTNKNFPKKQSPAPMISVAVFFQHSRKNLYQSS
jgi:hypothetical protein